MSKERDVDFRKAQVWRPFIFSVGAVISIFIMGIFLGLIANTKHLIETELRTSARSHFDNIVLTRRWNAQYGGVFVEKTPGMESNPYLKNPDIAALDGKTYTKKNPALMTREISEIAKKSDDTHASYQFHITSLKPLNPNNTADEFEKKSLLSFEAGQEEALTKVNRDEKTFYRYMAPLIVKESCLQCHEEQGYKVDDIRGGISVQFEITDIEKGLTRTSYQLLALGIIAASALFGVIYVFIVRVMRRLNEALHAVHKLATTDALTGLSNRRQFFLASEREMRRAKRYGHHISSIMLDVDFFKKINDQHGHQAGDSVLRNIGAILERLRRESDIIARYGGEEFAITLPETDQAGALIVAERIRQTIEAEHPLAPDGSKLQVTVSLGVASREGTDQEHGGEELELEQLIKLADDALYRAKEMGRNRVECHSE